MFDNYSKEEIIKINKETSKFYKHSNISFSQTRSNPWDGWLKCRSFIEDIAADGNKSTNKNNNNSKENIINVLDIGCGNCRFEKYLGEIFKDTKSNVYVEAIDNCAELIPDFSIDKNFSINVNVNFINCDLLKCILDDNTFPCNNKADIAVVFGVLHHIPSFELRIKLLNKTIDTMKKNGILIITLWQLSNDDKITKKAMEITPIALQKLNLNEVPENDFFLNWDNDSSVFRFCHNFSNEESRLIIEKLAGRAKLISNFNCDGRTGNLNNYLVFKKL